MATAAAHAATVNLNADRDIARWRPLVQWMLVIPHLLIVQALHSLRGILTLVSLASVLFTKRIPRPLFDAVAMTYRYEWRVVSYALFLHDDYPPFDFNPSANDDGHAPSTGLSITYPENLNRWTPLYKWLLAIPHYAVCLALAVASILTVVFAAVGVISTGAYPEGARQFLVRAYRYSLRVQAYVGLLTDEYPPFRLAA